MSASEQDAMETDESVVTADADANASPSPPEAATWSFVQMNMSLLPIARPLPVTTACHRFQESFSAGKKPRTPNQKLHRRVLQNAASNISPRRHELSGNVRRVSNTGLFGAASPSPSQMSERLRIAVPSRSAASFAHATLSPMDGDGSTRTRCQSDDPVRHHRVNNKRACEDSGYASDSCESAMPLRCVLLSRSVSLSAASDAKAYKGKRIMELLDEERRLHPDERSTSQSPTKRSRLQ